VGKGTAALGKRHPVSWHVWGTLRGMLRIYLYNMWSQDRNSCGRNPKVQPLECWSFRLIWAYYGFQGSLERRGDESPVCRFVAHRYGPSTDCVWSQFLPLASFRSVAMVLAFGVQSHL
jgi:hypothetical protein